MSEVLTTVDGWTINVPPLTIAEIADFNDRIEQYYAGPGRMKPPIFITIPPGMVFTPADDTTEIDPPVEVGTEGDK